MLTIKYIIASELGKDIYFLYCDHKCLVFVRSIQSILPVSQEISVLG